MTLDNIRIINRIPNNERDYFEDNNHNVFLDSWGKNPLFCKDCHVQQRCDLEGYFYCPHDGLKEQLPIEIKSIPTPNPLVSNTSNFPKGIKYISPYSTELHSTERNLYKHIKTKGFWHKRVVDAFEVTNEAIICNDKRIPLSSITDVFIMNKHNMGWVIMLVISHDIVGLIVDLVIIVQWR